MNKRLLVVLALLVSITYSCEEVFQYSPNEIRPGVKNLNAQNISHISVIGDTLRFILIADIHHAYEELQSFVNEVKEINGISFAAVAGDLTNFGLQYEYEEVHSELARLNIPYISCIGNHDLLGNGLKVFEEMYGPLNFSFRVGDNKFVFINTCSREYNFNGNVPDLDYLRSELGDTASFTNAFVVGHVPPWDSDFDPDLDDDYRFLLEKGKVKAALYGHQHDFTLNDYYQDGIQQLVADDLKDRSFVIIKVSGSSITFENKTF